MQVAASEAANADGTRKFHRDNVRASDIDSSRNTKPSWERKLSGRVCLAIVALATFGKPPGQIMTYSRSDIRTPIARRAARALGFSAAVLTVLTLGAGAAAAQTLGYAPLHQSVFPPDATVSEQAIQPDATDEQAGELPERLRRTVVSYVTNEAPGTIVIDTGNTALYYVLGGNRAIRYGVGVGREGFTWSGIQTISRKAEWPDWHPPAEMVARQPYLPRFMAGGPGNPLGARALYLGSSEYRIHGTNDPSTIGKFVSSGCIRLTNEDVEDLFNRVQVGTKVVVLPKRAQRIEARRPAAMQVAIHHPDRPAQQRTGLGPQALNLSPSVLH